MYEKECSPSPPQNSIQISPEVADLNKMSSFAQYPPPLPTELNQMAHS